MITLTFLVFYLHLPLLACCVSPPPFPVRYISVFFKTKDCTVTVLIPSLMEIEVFRETALLSRPLPNMTFCLFVCLLIFVSQFKMPIAHIKHDEHRPKFY